MTAAPDGGGFPIGSPTIKQVYAHQLFNVAETGQGLPTFSEVVDLPPGRHFVEVGLYTLMNGEDFSIFDDFPTARKKNIVVGGSGAVVVR